jgi:hypothetical protein
MKTFDVHVHPQVLLLQAHGLHDRVIGRNTCCHEGEIQREIPG